jgi:hypothetical protein
VPALRLLEMVDSGLAKRLYEIPLSHLRTPWDVLLLRRFVEFLSRSVLKRVPWLAAPLSGLRGLATQVTPSLLRQVCQGALGAGARLRTLDVSLGSLTLLGRSHASYLPFVAVADLRSQRAIADVAPGFRLPGRDLGLFPRWVPWVAR